jgi:hypothetical protein
MYNFWLGSNVEGQEPEPKLEPHKNFYSDPEQLKNEAAPQH